MKLKIFTPCWGKKHIELLKGCLALSLSWPKNREHVNGAEWVFVCEHESEFEEIKAIDKFYLFEGDVKAIIVPGLSQSNPMQALMPALMNTMRACIDEKSYFLMATPDFIFGDGTLGAFKTVGSDYGSCVSIAHMRVLPQVLDELTFVPKNAELQSLGFKYPHGSWVHANASFKDNCSYAGGVRWWDIGNNVTCVEHHLTSPFFVSFLEADLDVFSGSDSDGQSRFMIWDHAWPQALFKYGRFRYIGSSDAAIMLEVTDPEKNMPPLSNLPGCSKNSVHNRIQKQFISVFRGE